MNQLAFVTFFPMINERLLAGITAAALLSSRVIPGNYMVCLKIWIPVIGAIWSVKFKNTGRRRGKKNRKKCAVGNVSLK